LFKIAREKVEAIANKNKKKIKIFNVKKVRELSPKKFHVRVDFMCKA
jgi:tRNA G37 N-methylase Trm5